MAFDFYKLAEGSILGITASTVYANPASTKSYARMITLCNYTADAVNVTLYSVPDDATAVGTAADKDIFFNSEIDGYSTVVFEFPNPGFILTDQGDSIQALASVASSVTIRIDGGSE